MKKRYKIIIGIFTILILLILLLVMYFFVADIESTPTQEIKEVCNIKEERYNGRKVFIITSKLKSEDTSSYILYLHGGSYIAEVSDIHWKFLRDLAIDTNATLIVPDYPLSPKYDYKDVFNMIEPLYKEILEKIDSSKLILMGDSAGGGMALALSEKMGEENIIQPKKTILISPWLDVRLDNPKISEIEDKDKQLNKETLQLAGVAYIGNNESSYLVNPIDGPLENLKNVIIYTGTYDILNPDVHVLEQRAKEITNADSENTNTNIEIKEYDKLPHIWLLNRDGQEDEETYLDLIDEITK